MNYKTFMSLYSEALSFDDVDEYVLHHDWSDWMDSYSENEIGSLLQRIYKMAHSPLSKTRGMSQAEFSRLFGIPVRTVQDWDAGRRNPPSYVKQLICYALLESCYEKK